MNKKIGNLFDKIHAEPGLMEETAAILNSGANRKRTRVLRYSALVALFSLMIFFRVLYFTAISYIDIDVNPSIELRLNRFGRVIAAVPYNTEAAGILEKVNLRLVSYDAAIELLLGEMEREGYLEELLSVTLQTSGKEAILLEEIRATVSAYLESHHNSTQADIFPVTAELRKTAHENDVSPAKYITITELLELDPEASFEKCKEHSISELQQLKRHYMGGAHDTEEEEPESETPEGNKHSDGKAKGHGQNHH